METPKLLIAGLSEQTLNLVREAIDHLGYQVVPSRAMSLALFLAHKNLPEIIISDLVMTDGDGLTFLNEIKQDEELQSIPFIFCLDKMPGEAIELQAIKSGARKVVPNDLQPSEFFQIIEPFINERLKARAMREEQTPE